MEEILHRDQSWVQGGVRRGRRCIVWGGERGELCEWRDRRHRHPGQGPLRRVWGRRKGEELLMLAWGYQRESDARCG